MRRFSSNESRRFLVWKSDADVETMTAAKGGSRHVAEWVSTNFDKIWPIKKSLSPAMGRFGHEDELYHVAMAKEPLI